MLVAVIIVVKVVAIVKRASDIEQAAVLRQQMFRLGLCVFLHKNSIRYR